MKKQSMVLLLALVMALGLCVTTAWADGVSYFDPTASGSDQNKTCETYTLVTESTSTEPVTWEGGTSDVPKWYVVNENVTISGTVNVTGHVCLILCDGKTLTAEKGIEVAGYKSLTIYGQSGQSGKLVAKGACADDTSDNNYSSGISSEGTLTINGGVIEATGGTANSSYGIVASETITINAGTVTATGGEANVESHGICAAMDLIINGGTVNATGKKAVGDQYAISSGIFSYKSITINSGTVTAIGGEGEGGSYGICAYNYDLIVNGGTVTAESTDDNGKAIVYGSAMYLPESYYYSTDDAARYRTQNMYRPAALGGQYFELTTTTPAAENIEADAAIEPVKYMDHSGTGLVEGQCADYTTIVSRNGDVTLTGGTSDDSKWFVVKDDVTINGTLTFQNHARLILCDGAKLTVKGGSVDGVFCGVLICGTSPTETGSLTIYGQSGQTGELVAKGANGNEDRNDESYGINAFGALTINGGVIEARGGTNVDVSYGIYSTNDMTINAGRVTAEGRTANYSYGLFAQENLIVNGGVIEATGGKANATGEKDDAISAGIYVCNDDLIVNSGSVTARSGEATATGVEGIAKSYGIYAKDYLHLKNGTVIAETTADSSTEKAAVFYGKAYSMPDAYGTAWWWRTVKDGAYQAHPSFRVADLESDYFELITTDPYPHQHTRRQPTTTTAAPADSDKGTEDKTGVVTSAKTFDAGVAVYAGLGVLSLTGSAWVARKKW